ncbi:MAG: DHHW family protein [Clostridiales bacterium]|nr:DHHW family protein [Clostridiales bacterium]
MTQYILRKRIFAVVFLIAIFGFSAVNFVHSYEPLKEKVLEIVRNKEEFSVEKVAELETVITENMYGRMEFIETYGFVQTLLDKRECNNFSYIKDEEGFLHYASFYREEDNRLFEYAMRVKRLQDYAKTKGTKVLFVVPPGKYDKNYTKFRTGMPVNDPNYIVDEMMFYLNRLGVETLDLRECMPSEELTYEETFFKTDHHWTIPAAYYATCKIVEKMEDSFGVDLDPENYYTDVNNYDMVTYRKGMLGSMGRKTGANFCGIEDFTALWPHFEGSYTRVCMSENGKTNEKEGSFTECLMETSVLTEKTDIYSDSQYSLYLNGLRVYEKITNNENPEGCRIFMIRDSYFSPVMAFMMPMCGQIDAIWSLENTDELDIESYIKENEFDYIMIEVYPYNINSSAFNFFKEKE